MTWRVRHATRYRYSRPVELASHLLHLRPRGLPWQAVLSHALHTVPGPVPVTERLDHFGNHAATLFLHEPHATFEVVSEATVRLSPRALPAPDRTPPWEAVAWAAACPPAWRDAEFLFDSPLVPVLPDAGAFARDSFTPGRPVLAAALDLARRIAREFSFRPGATTVATPVARVLDTRAGVCQDFAQVMVSALRALGLPARYVSGYIRTRPPPGRPKLRGVDASHAWVGCWLGPALGWADLDPTNALLVGTDHVVLGWGRDFADVSPVSGIITGGGPHTVEVAVDLDPLDPLEAAERVA